MRASELGTLTFNTFPGAGQRSAFYGRQAIDLSTGYTVLPKPKRATVIQTQRRVPMDTEKTDQTKGGDGQTEAKKPVIEHMTDLAAAASGALAESAVKAVARKASPNAPRQRMWLRGSPKQPGRRRKPPKKLSRR